MSKKIPPLNELAAYAPFVTGSRRWMNSEAAKDARQDFLLYLGAASAGLVRFSLLAWFKVRLPAFDVNIGFDAVKAWALHDPEVLELKAYLAGKGPETTTVKKWKAAGQKAWK